MKHHSTKEDDKGYIQEMVLHLLSLETDVILSGTALKNLTVEKRHSFIKDSILYKIHTIVPAENVKTSSHTLSVNTPDGWFQMFKESYFTKWLKTRFPIVYKKISETVTFDAYVIYPQLPEIYECGNTRQVLMQYVKPRPVEKWFSSVGADDATVVHKGAIK